MTPIHRLKKAEIIWRATHTCRHRHSYLDHPACYEQEHPDQTRRGFLDIEASNLSADFGIVLTWCIKKHKGEIICDQITKKDIETARSGDEDKRVVSSLIQALGEFDEIVTFYGNDYRFDVPFIRTRAIALGLDFPNYGTLRHIDIYPILKRKFRLSRNRQENAARVLLGSTEKTHIDPKYWRGGARGDQESLAYILDHNKKDVKDLERLYDRLIHYIKRQDTSI